MNDLYIEINLLFCASSTEDLKYFISLLTNEVRIIGRYTGRVRMSKDEYVFIVTKFGLAPFRILQELDD